ncbi:hypothetical protein HPB52_001946 [Rhipicephalus sanguineus]|uniref:SCP domain-containing protein n=1 Tax=Rhipicephalus sanguineus TaxID=34632 RepID=A0A9D4PPV8_RHISA|nr:hypothetical protein HPB52_001946 [Rhipicephalus sanguineus]
MKLNGSKLVYLRVAEIALAIFFALNATVAEARTVSFCGTHDYGRVCKDVYRRYNEDHILCRQRYSSCQPVRSGIDDADKDIILTAHNRYRSEIATGNHSRLPCASNMLEMLAWATTWKVGCGYTLYSSRSAYDFEKRYTCAYGPGGNVRGEEVYKVGPACTDCPEGTCCGESCQQYNITPSYSGLCTTGHAESVLEAGQSAEMTFEQPIKSSHGRLCIEVEYNKGPNVAGTLDRGLFELLVTPVVRPQRQRTINLSGGAINTMRMRITLHYNFDVKIGFSFIVPRGSPAQYVNIHKVLIYEKACPERYRHALD